MTSTISVLYFGECPFPTRFLHKQEVKVLKMRPYQISAAVGWLLFASAPAIAAAPPTFEKDIRPILKAHCFECHGEGEKLKGGLDLRLRRLMLQGGDDGPVIVPGKPGQSLLFKLIHSGEMPKRDKKLTREQVALIKQWIATGAKTARPEPAELGKGGAVTEEERAFWSFQPIRKPAIPKTKTKDRVRTPIDAFLVSALAKQKLGFSPDAEQVTLLRRACFDLTGLPPTPAEVEAFLATATPGVADPDAVRNQVVADTIKIVSTSLLGLSVGCAQCHDHRYDPIPQADYYRLRAVIEPAYDWKNWRTPDQRLLSLYTEADRKKADEVEAEAKKLAEEKETKQKQYIDEALTKHLEKFEAPLRDQLRAAYDTPADKRTAEQKKLLADNPSVNINAGVLHQYNPKAADDLKVMDAKIAEIRGRKPPEDFVCGLTEPADRLPVTYLFHRGDPKQPKEAILPGGLSVLAPPGQSVDLPSKNPDLATSGRRLAFARWLTSGTN